MKTSHKLFALVALLVVVAACGFAVQRGLPTGSPPAAEQTEAPDGDCDAGDLRESKPDPDCGGLWLGTPTPAAKKTTAPAAPKKTTGPAAPAPKKTRR